MISELSFLIELLLKHKLPPATKDLIAKRIADVEESYISSPRINPVVPSRVVIAGPTQSPSTLAAMARHAETPVPPVATGEPVVPVAVIAQTPATAEAMAARAAMMMGGRTDPNTGRPKKFLHVGK